MITGTIALGLSARNSGVFVSRWPWPHGSSTHGNASSSQSHSTLRTLIEVGLPRILNIVCPRSVDGSILESADAPVRPRDGDRRRVAARALEHRRQEDRG